MPPVVSNTGKAKPPPGYRPLGKQAIRFDTAEKLLRLAHGARVASGGKPFVLDPALAISTGLSTLSYASLLRLAGFTASVPRPLGEGVFGPPQPARWRWRPARRTRPAHVTPLNPSPSNAFAALADLVR